jgi:hypothetical protein
MNTLTCEYNNNEYDWCDSDPTVVLVNPNSGSIVEEWCVGHYNSMCRGHEDYETLYLVPNEPPSKPEWFQELRVPCYECRTHDTYTPALVRGLCGYHFVCDSEYDD